MKESGLGRENGVEAYDSCRFSYLDIYCILTKILTASLDTQSKSIILNTTSPEESRAGEDWFADDGSMKRYG